MAAISRIQVANFLTDGFAAGKEWAPLYRGETFRLFGQPTAMQIDNGGGKTSLTEACLYTLTRDRRLRQRVEDRVAPVDKGWTHVRMEFIEKPHDEDILQADLITLDPVEIPGITYVVGMCWSRTKDPVFYAYQGSLDDAPCYTQNENGLTLVTNEAFRKSVERLPGARWNRWSNQVAWLDEIKQFTNIEVLRQNVEFQLEGAGDYSAMITKVKPEPNESYDAAFFRQFVAPELLKHTMGTEGDPDENKFEDTILKTLKPAADALLDINRRQQELDDTKVALQQFEPVLEKAGEVVSANADYEREVNALAQNAAIVYSLAVRSPLPGIPLIPANTQWASDRRVMAALGHMIIDKKHGAVITDEGLAALIGVEIGRVNQYAREKRVDALTSDLQTIELKDVLKQAQSDTVSAPGSSIDGQPIENKDVLKKTGRGGRRYSVVCYDIESALSLVSATSNLSGAKTAGLADVLTRAFGIAADKIDSNPYRRHLRKLGTEMDREKKRQQKAQTDYQQHQREYEALITQSREAEENQIAYEAFMARKSEYPEEYWESPVNGRAWAEAESKRAEAERTEHIRLSSKRKDGYSLWQTLSGKHGLITLPEALADLKRRHAGAADADKKARRGLDAANASLRDQRATLATEKGNAEKAGKRLDKLAELAASMPAFHEIYGDTNPTGLNPQAETATQQAAKQKNDHLLQDAYTKKQELLNLLPKVRTFVGIFGEVDPSTLTPSSDLSNHMQAIAVEETLVTEHLPLVEGLAFFREQHPGTTPEEWLVQTASQRRALIEERAGNERRIVELKGELEDLTAFGAADDHIYSRALRLLADHDIAFGRLHELASSTTSDARLEYCLTLFSSFLSAPVIESVEAAGEAARLLEAAKLTVPIFLKPTLVPFLLNGEIRQSSELAYTLWIGRRTRQVDILLNPALIDAEKVRINGEIQIVSARNQDIEKMLAGIAEDSDAVKTALNAKAAIRKHSERFHSEAAGNLERLHGKTPDMEHRASTEAQEAISAMKHYIRAGGETRYQEYVETVIPALEREKGQIEQRLGILAVQTTETALRALHAAKDFHQSGGQNALDAAKSEFDRLSDLVNSLDAIVSELQSEVEDVLKEAAATAAEALRLLNETYALDMRDLELSVSFEEQGFVAFMESADNRMEELDEVLRVAQKRLQGIDFERANRYIRSSKSESRDLADRIAKAKEDRDKANQDAEEAVNAIARIDGEMSFMVPFMESMHEMVVAIRTQHAKITGFSEDIRRLALDSPVTDPEILDLAETVRIACIGDIPGIDPAVRAAMLNLGHCIGELEIDTVGLIRISEARKHLSDEFTRRRDGFCERARNGEIKGLNQLEISIIAKARTVEELRRIQETRDSIQGQINEIAGNLDKIRETMKANKEASINSLASVARQAELSLKIMERVMARTPGARFHVDTPVADEEEIEKIISELLAQIEDRELAIRERGVVLLNHEIERKAADYKQLIHNTIYRRIFTGKDKENNPIPPRVFFTHASIRGTERVPYTDRAGLSTGQKTALAMMWLIKQAEFAIVRAASLYSTRKEQKTALKGAQRIMFFDGLFSNLSNEDYINDAFQGLRGVGENFQLIGLIHNPYYVNNKDIFPVHLVGRKKVATGGISRRRHVFVSIEPQQDENGMILFTSAYKHHLRAGTLEQTVHA